MARSRSTLNDSSSRSGCMRCCSTFLASLAGTALLTDYLPCRSLDELVKDKVNGLVFHTAQELAAQLEVRFSPFPCSSVPPDRRDRYRRSFAAFPLRLSSQHCVGRSSAARPTPMRPGAVQRKSGSGARGRKTGTTSCGRCCCMTWPSSRRCENCVCFLVICILMALRPAAQELRA